MIGGNDVILATLAGLSGPVADAALTSSVSSEIKQIKTLADDGAKNFVVVNVPDVGLIPLVSGNPSESAAATMDSQFYDSQLNTQLASLGLPADTALHEFDLYDFNTTILDDATASGSRTRRTPASATRRVLRPQRRGAASPTSTISSTGTTSILAVMCRPCGPLGWKRWFPSRRPG
jgi:phospholipase/lecithinase/hemolysin